VVIVGSEEGSAHDDILQELYGDDDEVNDSFADSIAAIR
jgi:hypothetical protein